MANWNPALEPFRVVTYRISNGRGMYGWDSDVKTYATLQDGLVALDEKMRRGQTEKVLQKIAGNFWLKVASRKNGKTTVITAKGQKMMKGEL